MTLINMHIYTYPVNS